jgi:hypothetical protein
MRQSRARNPPYPRHELAVRGINSEQETLQCVRAEQRLRVFVAEYADGRVLLVSDARDGLADCAFHNAAVRELEGLPFSFLDTKIS